MPVLNGAGTIMRALDSIQGQGDLDVEILVQDGGSTDGTLDLLAGRPGVSCVSEPDRGLSDAFNKGAARADGELLGWLNADDAYLPGALSMVLEAFRSHPELTWMTGPCIIVDGQGRPIRQGVTKYKNFLLRHWSPATYLTQNFVSAPSTFFRRDAFERVGGMDLGLRYSMDYDLYLRLGLERAPLIITQPLAEFTMAEGTLSMTGFRSQFREHEAVARRYRDYSRLGYRVNVVTSRGIVVTYRTMQLLRDRRNRRV